MEQTWRWFGPDDAIGLSEIRQTGATAVVTALHQIPYGVVWSPAEIATRKAVIEAAGLRWSVVESLPVAEAIKQGTGDLETLFSNYRESLRNLGAAGVTTVCYNFMPVLDWTRTELRAPLPGGGTALRFNAHQFAAFDCLMLQRQGAEVVNRAQSAHPQFRRVVVIDHVTDSSRPRRDARNWAARAPSSARWSQDMPRIVIGRIAIASSITTGRLTIASKSRIATCGWLITGVAMIEPY